MEPHQLPPFRGLSARDVASALGSFEEVRVDEGQPLMAEGEVDSSLLLVLEGELRITAGPLELGRAGPGEVIGETAMLTASPRSATVTAVAPSRLLVLQGSDYVALRKAGSPVAAAIEKYALELVTERLIDAGRKVGARSKGTELADVTPPKGWMARVRELLGTGGQLAPPTLDVAETLRKLRFFGDASDAALSEIAPHLEVEKFDAGTFLCTRGELGHQMYILVDGEVDTLLPSGQDRVEPLSTLRRGDVFGTNALCTGGPRTVFCVTRSDVVVLTMRRAGWNALIGKNSPGGSALRVAVVRRAAAQLAYANAELTLREMTNPTRLRKSYAALDSHGAFLG